MVDRKQRGEWKKLVVAQIQNVVRAGLAETHLVPFNVSVLVELSETFVEPERYPGFRLAKHEVRVLVINDRVRMLHLRIEPNEDVIFVRHAQEQAGKLERALRQISSRLYGLEFLAVFEG